MSTLRALRPSLPILIGASVMLSLAMGLRQSLGLFMPPLTRDTGISVSDFTLAIAVQNLAWGFLQPIAGAWAARLGMRRLMVGGALLYTLGLVLLATASGLLGVMLGAGVAIGAAQHSAGHRLGGGLAGCHAGRAAGPGPDDELRLACGRVGLRGAGADDGARGLGGRPCRCAADAAQDG
jgi:MFS family permease